ncbi:MAG TPA: hypothetical protein VGI32_03105 [Steroidobacteraceae bacterium]|jgi:hypothetical protein
MQMKQFFLAAAILFCLVGQVSQARADTVVYDSVGFIQGSQSFVDTFNITTPGTLTISMSDVPWLDTLSNLSFFLTSANGTFGAPMNGGSESMNIGAGTFYAHWFGEADGQYQVGVYSLKISFQPAVSAVPLPASLILLLSGLTLMFGRRWGRAPVGQAATA